MRENSVRGPAIDLGEFERRLRAPERKEAGADPLGELARLIQGEETAAADPYSRILAEPRPLRPSAPDTGPVLRGSYEEASEANYEDHGYIEPTVDDGRDFEAQRYPAHEEDTAVQDDYRGAEGGWSDDAQYLDYGQEQLEPFDEPRGPRSWFRPWHAVAAISLLAIASIGWGFAHRGGDEGAKEIATITAPEGPVKVKPTAETESEAPGAGGAAVLDRKDSEQVKQIVTNQEQAVEPTLAPNAATLGLPQAPSPAIPAPKKVKTVTVRPDGTRVDDAEALPPAVSRATRPAAPEKPATPPAQADKPATPKPVAKPKTEAPKTEAPKTTLPKTALPKTPPKAPPKVAAAPAAEDAAPPTDVQSPAAPPDAQSAAAPVAKGGYAVQFGAATTEAEASALIKSVSTKYGASLGGHRPSFAKATVGDKTVYRVRVGGVSKESAAAICGKVKASGGSCFVAGN